MTLRAIAYLQLQKGYGNRVKVTAVTANAPRVQRGTLLTKLVLELPDDAFTTFIPEATIRLEPGTGFKAIVAYPDEVPADPTDALAIANAMQDDIDAITDGAR